MRGMFWKGDSKGSAPGPCKDSALDPGSGCRQWRGETLPLVAAGLGRFVNGYE